MDHGFLPGSEAEWTGLFLFGVGVFGVYHQAIMRHWLFLGRMPLSWFYMASLMAGAGLLLACSPLAPWQPKVEDESRFAFMARLFRGLIAFAMLVTVLYVAFKR